MKRMAIPSLILLITFAAYGQSYNYDPFFSVRIVDNEGTEFLLSNIKYFNSDRELKYFFWIRRGNQSGTASYQIDFKKIINITFTQVYDGSVPDYTAGQITLSSGEIFDVLINTTGSIGGMDNSFGVYGEVYLNYNIIQSIEFLHKGQYKQCSFCKALFYDSLYDVCPFDQSELIRQNQN